MVTMAKRRYGKKHRSAMARRPHVPIGMAACAVVDGAMIYEGAKAGFSPASMNNLQYYFTGTGDGVSGVDVHRLIQTYGKYAAAGIIHIGANKLGVNRYISKFTRGYVTI